MKHFLIIPVIIVSILLPSCTNENEPDSCDYDQIVTISEEEYNSAPDDILTINSLTLNGDCLLINFSSSGCSGETWELKLIDSGSIMESAPPQRNLRLSLKNDELCDAYLTRELSFYIKALQVGGSQVKLNIINSGDQVLYTY